MGDAGHTVRSPAFQVALHVAVGPPAVHVVDRELKLVAWLMQSVRPASTRFW